MAPMIDDNHAGAMRRIVRCESIGDAVADELAEHRDYCAGRAEVLRAQVRGMLEAVALAETEAARWDEAARQWDRAWSVFVAEQVDGVALPR
jgi:hypothetical protein